MRLRNILGSTLLILGNIHGSMRSLAWFIPNEALVKRSVEAVEALEAPERCERRSSPDGAPPRPTAPAPRARVEGADAEVRWGLNTPG